MTRQRPFECRFGVGNPDGKHSLVWKVWASRNTPDVYVTARSMGGAMKASIHASGERHVGLTKEHARDKNIRHYDHWFGGQALAGGISLEFLIQIPTVELRSFPLRESDLKDNVVWLQPAPELQIKEIGILILSPDVRPTTRDREQLIAAGVLSDSRQVWVTWSNSPNKQLVENQAPLREMREQMESAGVPFDDRARFILGIKYDAIRSFTEIAASSPLLLPDGGDGTTRSLGNVRLEPSK
jgi:hypothetical protein